jgi:hypothetical protein
MNGNTFQIDALNSDCTPGLLPEFNRIGMDTILLRNLACGLFPRKGFQDDLEFQFW